MAGIATATVAQVQTARDATVKLDIALQAIVDGSRGGKTSMSAASITAVDALIDAQVAAIALLNT